MVVEERLIRAVHAEHGAALLSAALAMTGGDLGRAQDAVQEVLLRAWRHPEALDESRGSTRGWLLRTLRNVLIDRWRHDAAHPETITDRPPEVVVGDRADAVAQSWLVQDALRQLSVAHREVIVECFYRGASVSEAAARLEVPAGTVKSRMYYALRELRTALTDKGVIP